MLQECIEALQIKCDGIYVDCTTNRGGHSLEIIKRLNGDLNRTNKKKLKCISESNLIQLVEDKLYTIEFFSK